ncbi:adenylate and guanylate cyclase catalytic domain-containing protein [Obelidium mucronatum]|nr:adenylate and guanylate cyclase catalytic domain-containing protein [Obelidium mucronatum]
MLSPLFSPMGGGRGTGSRPPASTPIATKLEIAEAQDKTPPINPYVEKLYMWFTETVCAVYQGVDYSVPPSILSSNPDIRGSKDSFDHWMKSPLSSKSAAESNDSLLHDINFNLGSEYMTPFLKFKIPELEKEYQYNILLPTKVVHLRLGSAALGLYSIGYLVWYCAQHGVQGEIWRYITIASICILCISCFVVSTWQNGKMIVVLPSESFAWRVTLTLIKILTWCSTLCYDFLNTTNPTDSLGSAANLVIYCLFFTTGLSGTFLDRIYSFLCVVAIVVVKAMLISSTGSWVGVAIYLLPLLTTCLLSIDEIYTGDKDRRMRHLNTKIVQSRLKGLKGESQKTEYLLSLTLPPMIVTKLKEVGTANFDLIAERFDLTSVMFTDIKNYKEVAQSISTRHGVNLLNTIFHHMDNVRNEFKNLERIKTINSKMLIVGGLDKQDDVDHLVELIDMALIYRDMFQQEVSCSSDSKGQTILSAKLQIGMGISIGPLVAGIVGKKTFCYEVYGDVVNTASRMLSIAKEGQIIVTSQVWELIKTGIYHANFLCDLFKSTIFNWCSFAEYMGTYIGEREVKGKGLMKVYCIDKMRNAADMPESIPSSISSSRKQSNRTSFLNKNRRKSSAITPIKGRHIDTEIFQSIILSGNSNRLSEESLVNSLSNLSLKQKVAQGVVRVPSKACKNEEKRRLSN